MSLLPEDVNQALDYADLLKITADLDPRDNKTLRFHLSRPIPDHLPDEIKTLLDLCIEYHQRSTFTGEYLEDDDNPPVRQSAGALEEINFFLKYYHHRFIREVKKALEVDKETNEKSKGPRLTPMLR